MDVIEPALKMADRFAELKKEDAYSFTLACRATANYGAARTEANRTAMEAALDAAVKATDSFETGEMVKRLTEVAHKLGPASKR